MTLFFCIIDESEQSFSITKVRPERRLEKPARRKNFRYPGGPVRIPAVDDAATEDSSVTPNARRSTFENYDVLGRRLTGQTRFGVSEREGVSLKKN